MYEGARDVSRIRGDEGGAKAGDGAQHSSGSDCGFSNDFDDFGVDIDIIFQSYNSQIG